MKKTYINPSIDVYELKITHQLLAGSENLGIDSSASPVAPSSADSRYFDFDDEEDW